MKLYYISAGAAIALSGCSIVPDLPAEEELPVQEIMLNAVCELRTAFFVISRQKKFANFKPGEWAINITLTPKIDTQLYASFGYSGRSTPDKTALRFITWTLGTSPGLRAGAEGHRDGAVTFPLKSSQLLDEKNYPIQGCVEHIPAVGGLSQYLGVREWLERIIPESASGIDKVTRLDKPSYSTQIVVKVDGGAAGATFFIPNGSTYTPAVAGLRKRDETLSITMTPEPRKIPVNTLPKGAIRKTLPGVPASISPEAQSRLDQIGLERALQNLRGVTSE
jgi:hypothetical protein